MDRELKIIQGEGQKSVNEIDERTKAEVKRIEAESQLKAAEIRAQTLINASKTKAEGEQTAMLTQVNAEGQCKKIQANQENEVAQKNAERVLAEGRGEEGLKGVLGLRRQYQQLNKKLDVVKQMGLNPELRIFGHAQDSAMTQLAAYQMSGSRV